MLCLILMVFAFVLVVIGGFRPPANPPIDVLGYRLVCFALACFFLASIVADLMSKGGGLHVLG